MDAKLGVAGPERRKESQRRRARRMPKRTKKASCNDVPDDPAECGLLY